MSDTDLTLAVPLDFNDPQSVERGFAQWAQHLLDDDSDGNQIVGLFLKNEVVGFTAALADFQRQGMGPQEFIAAVTQGYASILALLLGGSASDLDEAVKKVGKVFLETFVKVASENAPNRVSALKH